MAALSLTIYLSACANSRAALGKAAADVATADLVDAAIAVAARQPERPADCRRKEYSGVTGGERLDIAWLKAERALERTRARQDRCNAWEEESNTGND